MKDKNRNIDYSWTSSAIYCHQTKQDCQNCKNSLLINHYCFGYSPMAYIREEYFQQKPAKTIASLKQRERRYIDSFKRAVERSIAHTCTSMCEVRSWKGFSCCRMPNSLERIKKEAGPIPDKKHLVKAHTEISIDPEKNIFLKNLIHKPTRKVKR